MPTNYAKIEKKSTKLKNPIVVNGKYQRQTSYEYHNTWEMFVNNLNGDV